jgi:hypothetical protein
VLGHGEDIRVNFGFVKGAGKDKKIKGPEATSRRAFEITES